MVGFILGCEVDLIVVFWVEVVLVVGLGMAVGEVMYIQEFQ